MSPLPDTIFALSSGRLPAAIAVVRISGPRAGDALKALAGRIPEPRKAAFARVRDPASAEPIDDALALWFPGPNSETGEDTAELQLHGGRAVLAATLAALGRIEGCRPAEAGEFTRRAFENGKIDLTTVEGLADLVAAETEGQRRQALRQMQGALRSRAESWRERLVKALALTEAGIDFSDEGDVPEDLSAPARAIARELEAEVATVLRDAARGERLREGFVVAIAGPPNAGKSTLLNRLAQREVAIVSPHAGTTRDVIEVHLDLDGWPVTLLDTAGIRDTADPVEMEGVRRARDRAAAADLVLWVVDATRPLAEQVEGLAEAGRTAENGGNAAPAGENAGHGHSGERTAPTGGGPGGSVVDSVHPSGEGAGPGPHGSSTEALPPAGQVPGSGLRASGAGAARSAGERLGPGPRVSPADRSTGDRLGAALPAAGRAPEERGLAGSREVPVWLIVNKADLLVRILPLELALRNESKIDKLDDQIIVSSLSGAGMPTLLDRLSTAAGRRLAASEPALVTRERQRRALQEAHAALARAGTGPMADDLLAEELRLAARAFARLTGRVDVEDILEVIFRDFCVGK